MDGWVKVFADHSIELGFDYLVNQKKASWSQGRLNQLIQVNLFISSSFASLFVPNSKNWHQFDRFIVYLGQRKRSYKTASIVQVELQEHHIKQYICYNKTNSGIVYTILPQPKGQDYKVIQPSDIGKWLTLELQVNGNTNITLAPKGYFSGK